jgi:hypothetical protein
VLPAVPPAAGELPNPPELLGPGAVAAPEQALIVKNMPSTSGSDRFTKPVMSCARVTDHTFAPAKKDPGVPARSQHWLRFPVSLVHGKSEKTQKISAS